MNKSKVLIIGIFLIVIFGISYIFLACQPTTQKSTRTIDLVDSLDSDIVLINFEEGDRAFIRNLLLKIDSCKPKLIAVDAQFVDDKEPKQDSVLMNAFKVIQNDILAYGIDSGKAIKPISKFGAFVTGMGSTFIQTVEGLSTTVTPLQTIDNEVHEQFALQVIKNWKPDFKPNFKTDESIVINFSRTLKQFIHFNGSELTANNCKDLKNKVVLVGYLGPGQEDKLFTPLRRFGRYDADEPDTYGLVVIANEIRTLLEYEQQD
jgi:CHASE2 domain-containing sensor protein